MSTRGGSTLHTAHATIPPLDKLWFIIPHIGKRVHILGAFDTVDAAVEHSRAFTAAGDTGALSLGLCGFCFGLVGLSGGGASERMAPGGVFGAVRS